MKRIYHAQLDRVYTGEEVFHLSEDEKFRRRLVRMDLKSHSVYNPIQKFIGYTPIFELKDFGFQEVAEFDLLDFLSTWQNLDEVLKIPEKDRFFPAPYGKVIEGENVLKARRLAGSDEVFERQRIRIERTFNELNADQIEFIVFRTFRNYPASWDKIYFYTQGGSKFYGRR